MSLPTGRPSRPTWIWPFAVPPRIGLRAYLAATRLADFLGPPYRWLIAGALVGALTLLGDYLVGGTAGRAVAAIALGAMLTAAAARGSNLCGIGCLAAAFAAHCFLAIYLAAESPTRLSYAMPGGPEYWEESRTWIVTGRNPEYELARWVPAHLGTLLGASAFSYLSLGTATIHAGLHQVDVMCFYAGRLAASSRSPATAVALGWHPWSVCRGVGFVILTFEIVNLSFSRLTGRRLSTGRQRLFRWGAGLFFLLMDAGLKFALMESVRAVLAANLL